LPPNNQPENQEQEDDLLAKYLVQSYAYLSKSGGLSLAQQSRQEDIYEDYSADMFSSQAVWQAFNHLRFLLQPGNARNLALEFLLEKFEPGIVTSVSDLVVALK
jgi:hypothetical protein